MNASTSHLGPFGALSEPSPPIRSQPHASKLKPARRFRRVIVVASTLVVLALLAGFIPRWLQRNEASADTNQLAVSTVSVVSPAFNAAGDGLTLPAEIKPWVEAAIYAQASGYLKRWLVDIGAHVEQDQLLAEIDTPDLNQQLEQARSQLVLAQTNFDLAKTTNEKWQQLFRDGAVSELEAANTAAAEGVQAANLDNNKANVRRLEELQAFQRVTAPFAGTITLRNTDVGELIAANNTGKQLFYIQQTGSLRVYFHVPQSIASNFAVGQTVDVLVPEHPGKVFRAKVAATSESVAATSRTLLVQLQLDNSNGEIKAGSYAQVRLNGNLLGQNLTLPSNTLLFRGNGMQVGVVNAEGAVELRNLEVGRDFGTSIEVLGGVTQSDKIIVNPSDSLTTGTVVRVAATELPASPDSAVAQK